MDGEVSRAACFSCRAPSVSIAPALSRRCSSISIPRPLLLNTTRVEGLPHSSRAYSKKCIPQKGQIFKQVTFGVVLHVTKVELPARSLPHAYAMARNSQSYHALRYPLVLYLTPLYGPLTRKNITEVPCSLSQYSECDCPRAADPLRTLETLEHPLPAAPFLYWLYEPSSAGRRPILPLRFPPCDVRPAAGTSPCLGR